jgi:nucleotide-binding universal stress UspA family protein
MAKQMLLDMQAASLDVQAPLQRPMRPYGYGAEILIDEYETMLQAMRHAAEQSIGPLREAVKDLGDRMSVSMLEMDLAFAARAFAARCRTADVVVLGQPTVHTTALERAVLKGALLGSGRPCLILPNWETPRQIHGRAVVAWKGTPEAARAVRDALPLLRRAEVVRIFCAASADELDGEGQHSLARLGHYLAKHGVAVEPPVVTAPPDEILNTAGNAILGEVSEFDAHLLVMGGFGHSRLAEIVFGGATQRVLLDAPCAVLMSH